MKILIIALSIALCAHHSAQAQLSFSRSSESNLWSTAPVPKSATVLVPPKDFPEKLNGLSAVEISIPTTMGTWIVQARTFNVMQPDAVVIERTVNGEKYHKAPYHALVRGTLKGISNSYVFMAVFQDYVTAIIEIDEAGGRKRWLIAPDTLISGRLATHVLFEEQPDDREPWRCSAEQLPDYQKLSDEVMRDAERWNAFNKTTEQIQSSTQHTLGLALECSFSYYKRHDTSVAYAAQYAITLAAASSSIYQRDANVKIEVPYLRVWTVQDPYLGEIGEQLTAIRNEWDSTMKHVKRSTTCLLTVDVGGGLAWVGVLCGNYGYNVSGVIGKQNFPRPAYTWDIDVFSHELGHNIGSSHTHNCNWNPPIDSCWNAEGGCFKYTLPQRGSIMSYCHLQWQGTSLAFHPRVASLFNSVMDRTKCVWASSPRSDTDLAVVAIVEPGNGAMMGVGQNFTPRIIIRNVGNDALSNFTVGYRITTTNNVTVNTQTVEVSNLSAGAEFTPVFPRVSLAVEDDYLFEAFATIDGDKYLANNTLVRPIQVKGALGKVVEVLSPNGGEVLKTGSKFTIRFLQQNTRKVMVEYSADGASTWNNVRGVVNAGTDSTEWVVPATPTIAAFVRVVDLENGMVWDVSDAPFTIQTDIDVQAIDIVSPAVNTTVQTPLVPRVVIHNNGSMSATSVEVRLTMRWVRRESVSFDEVIVLPTLAANSTDTVTFPSTAYLADGTHVVMLTVQATQDADATNNTFGRSFTSIGLSPPRSVRVEPGPNRVQIQWELPSPLPSSQVELWRGSSAATMQNIRTFSNTVTAYVDDGRVNDEPLVYAFRTIFNGQQSVFTDLHAATPHVYPHGLSIARTDLISPKNNAVKVMNPATLRWKSAPNYDRYEVQIAADSLFASLRQVFITNADGAIDAEIGPKSSQWWRVRGLNQTVNGEWSTGWQFTTTEYCGGNMLQFDGDRQNATRDSVGWNGGPVTVEYWTKVDASEVKNSTTFMFGMADNSSNRFQAHSPWSDRRVYWDYGNIGAGGRISVPFDRYLGIWTHVALVSNGSDFMAIYLNGELAAEVASATTPTTLSGVTLGSMRGGNYFKGKLDEFRIWNTVRSPQQIKENMRLRVSDLTDRVSLIHAWSCNDDKGLNIADSGTAGKTLVIPTAHMIVPSGAIVNCEIVQPLVAPQQLTGRAVDHWESELSWIASPDADCYEIELYETAGKTRRNLISNPNVTETAVTGLTGLPTGVEMTANVRAVSASRASAWSTIKFNTPTSCENTVTELVGDANMFTNSVFEFDGGAGTIEFWTFIVDSARKDGSTFRVGMAQQEEFRIQAHLPWSDDRYLYWDAGDHNNGGRIRRSFENQFGKWTHVALTSNGVDEMQVYFDGVEAAGSSFASAFEKSKSIAIGGHPEFKLYFKGLLSDFRVWNVVRTADQIREAMYSRLVGKKSGLQGSWPLDDSRSNTAQDLTLFANHATAKNDVAWSVTTRPLAQTEPWLFAPDITKSGDTLTYVLHGSMASDVQWTVTGGTAVVAPTRDSIRIAWTSSGSVGRICVERTFEGGCTDSKCFDINLLNIVGVDELPESEFTVTPNPASNTITVETPVDFNISSIELYSVGGLYHGTLQLGLNQVDSLPNGTYIIRLVSPTLTKTVLFVVIH